MRQGFGWFRRRKPDGRQTMQEFNKIIEANYRPNIGRVLPGELPVIAPRARDFESEDRPHG